MNLKTFDILFFPTLLDPLRLTLYLALTLKYSLNLSIGKIV